MSGDTMNQPVRYELVATDPDLGTLVAAKGEDGEILAIGFDGVYPDRQEVKP